MYDTPQEWLRRIGRARIQRERESNARNDLHADSDRRVESPKASIPLGIGLVWTQISRASLTVIILRYVIEKRLRAVWAQMQMQIQIYVSNTKIVVPNSSNLFTAFIAPPVNACFNTKLNWVTFQHISFDMSREN